MAQHSTSVDWWPLVKVVMISYVNGYEHVYALLDEIAMTDQRHPSPGSSIPPFSPRARIPDSLFLYRR
jgi:hypothetical protein